MKKHIVLFCLFFGCISFSQEHFSGISTSKKVGLLNATINPAELVNLSSRIEVNLFSTSISVSNNKIGISDVTENSDFEELIFSGSEPVNLRFDAEINGPGIGIKTKNWAFGINSKAYGKLNLVDIDANLGDAISNNGLNALTNSTTLSGNYNQRLNGTTYGEIGLMAARNLFENEKIKLNGGFTLKLLFPGSYANFGADQFTGTVNHVGGNSYLTNTTANLNIAYSGNLGESFTDFESYSSSLFGGLNGFATDFGLNLQWKDGNDGFKLNTGLAVKNLGRMKFTDSNNNSTNYTLSIQGLESLNLNQFENVDSLKEVEQILLNSGYLTKINSNKDFNVKLPTVLSAYVDLKLVSKFYVSLFTQQKIKDDEKNDQVTTQNYFTLTPRLSLTNFEVYAPLSTNEISGFSSGFGLRFRGFYIGSGSVFTALINDSKQVDVYFGFRFGIGKS